MVQGRAIPVENYTPHVGDLDKIFPRGSVDFKRTSQFATPFEIHYTLCERLAWCVGISQSSCPSKVAIHLKFTLPLEKILSKSPTGGIWILN
jgi:hypothetical protein